MFNKILVPLDGSEAAEMVIPYVLEIAGRSGGQVVLVSVSETRLGDSDARHLYGSYLGQMTNRVKQGLWDLGVSTAEQARSEVLIGRPADEILRYANLINADLMIMASRGASGEGPWLLGSIAAKVLRATSRPVLLIRTPAKPAASNHLMKRILVPLDGSPAGAAAIPLTEGIARMMGAEVILINSIEPSSMTTTFGEMGVSLPQPMVVWGRRDEAVKYLEGIKQDLEGKGIKASVQVTNGSAAEQIVDYANSNSVDLVAMSSHGRTGVGRWVFGNVTDKVLHLGTAPVLVVRAAKT